jgi:transposase-like protein
MRKISYAGYRFPPEVIHQAIWLYLRFTLSFRDVEDLLAERGIAVSQRAPLGEPLRADAMRPGILTKSI